ncbi:MAG: hypothetical protein V3S30_02735 [Thermoanaerobaculia bacterium]
MKVLTGRVVDGKIDVGTDLQEGSAVAVLAIEPESVVLSEADERELADALAELRAGNFIQGRELVAELKAQILS